MPKKGCTYSRDSKTGRCRSKVAHQKFTSPPESKKAGKPKKAGFAYDMCLKKSDTRANMYKKKAVITTRSNMCSPGQYPRCVKGLAYCVKIPKKRKPSVKKPKHLLLK
jgi:hypothetical protein